VVADVVNPLGELTKDQDSYYGNPQVEVEVESVFWRLVVEGLVGCGLEGSHSLGHVWH